VVEGEDVNGLAGRSFLVHLEGIKELLQVEKHLGVPGFPFGVKKGGCFLNLTSQQEVLFIGFCEKGLVDTRLPKGQAHLRSVGKRFVLVTQHQLDLAKRLDVSAL